jgi:DNA-binding transcriptional regulator GbsR (MarR family)
MKVRAAPLAPRLQQVEDQFVELWNNMATLWGISPTMARIHGLLYISGAALSMDDIMQRLEISRGNVSMNLSKLVEWGLVRRVHKKRDRKEYYESLHDVWEMFTLVASQRKRRELDPIINTLRRCKEPESGRGSASRPAAAHQRLAQVLDARGQPGAAVLREPSGLARSYRAAGAGVKRRPLPRPRSVLASRGNDLFRPMRPA